MNLAHLHLILNHAPVLGTAFGLGLLLYGLWRRSDELKKAALGVLVIVSLLAIPAYLTGEPAEEVVESLPGDAKAIIERHEDAAVYAFSGILVLGAAALTGLIVFRRGREIPAPFSWGLLGASVIVGGLMAWTANLGGEIRHSEIRSVPAVGISITEGNHE
jgi:uncharacterized membrane protein